MPSVQCRSLALRRHVPAGVVPAPAEPGLSKSADLPSLRGAVGGTNEGVDGVGSRGLDLLVIQIDGIHMDEDLVLVAAVGVDAKGDKYSTHSASPRVRLKMRRPFRRSSTISLSAARGCSSSTARRRCMSYGRAYPQL